MMRKFRGTRGDAKARGHKSHPSVNEEKRGIVTAHFAWERAIVLVFWASFGNAPSLRSKRLWICAMQSPRAVFAVISCGENAARATIRQL